MISEKSILSAMTFLPWYDTSTILLPLLLLSILLIPLYILLTDHLLHRRMPPGPPPLPLLGNKRSLPTSRPWLQFAEWSKLYGPIYTIWIGRRPTIIISDPCVAAELLEKRSANYSSRPRFVVMGEVYWQMSSILVQPYGKAWSVRRRALHAALAPQALRLYRPVQEAEAVRLCVGLMTRPEGWEKEVERFTASVVFAIAYGHRIDSLGSRVLRQRFEFMQYSASLNVPGAFLAETWPVLKYVPEWLAPWKKEVRRRGRLEAAANMKLVEDVKNDIARSKAQGTTVPDSLTKLLLDLRSKGEIPLSDRDFSFIPASLFGAGADTTASTLCSAILALITHPSTLHFAQKELDAVVGASRTPTFADEPNLPYMRALIKEVLRWRPVAVLGGTPHASTADDVYEGWFIPRGTTVLGNSWAINLNESYYPSPHLFEPARFLDNVATAAGVSPTLKGRLAHPARTGHSSFGWGRRVCPGEGLALNSLFAALAKVVWGFEIEGVQGRVYDVSDYTEGFNIRPRRFACILKVRSEAHKRVLEAEMDGAERVLEGFTAFEE